MKKINKIFIILVTLAFLFVSCTSATSVTRTDNEPVSQISNDPLMDFYEMYKGSPYRIGSTGPNSFDCSGFVQKAYKEVYGINLPRTSSSQFMRGIPVRRKKNLEYGDLVFFNTSGRGVSHVGIYFKNGEFIHASTSLGVVISDIDMNYYKSRFIEGRRIKK